MDAATTQLQGVLQTREALWLRPDDGHVSVLGSCGVAALDWLVAQA